MSGSLRVGHKNIKSKCVKPSCSFLTVAIFFTLIAKLEAKLVYVCVMIVFVAMIMNFFHQVLFTSHKGMILDKSFFVLYMIDCQFLIYIIKTHVS